MNLNILALVKKGLSRIELFSRHIVRRPLHDYQLVPARAIIDSVLHRRGLEFAVLFPRQSGKNETQAHVEAYLLNLCQFRGGEIVKAQPTFQPQALNALRRLISVLDRQWISLGWRVHEGYQVRMGRACMTFFSANSQASVSGATASLLLECDEAQDVREADWDKKFLPMGASTNATVVYWGTAWTSRTLLAKTIRHLRALEAQDSVPRVFVVTPEQVAAVNPAYGRYVAREVAKKGRQHPLIKTQFFNEEIDGEGGMFPAARRALMRGRQRRLEAPLPERLYALLLDVAGEDEGASGDRTPTVEMLENPKRDATALTIVEVDLATVADALIAAPTYRVVHRRLWVGTKHTLLYAELRALALLWRARYLVADNTGIGAGLVAFLGKGLPAGTVIPYEFNTRTKSDLGWDFLNLCDAGRWQDYEAGAGDPAAITFWTELAFCQYEALPGPNHRLRWGVPAGTRDPDSGELVHDDTVLSAALVTVLDDQPWHVPTGPTFVIRGRDPLDEMSRGY